MKIKVDKEEYEMLLEKVAKLEQKAQKEYFDLYRNWRWTRETLYKMMEDYFKSQCMTVILKRDKDMIVSEIRKNVIDNLFKEKESE